MCSGRVSSSCSTSGTCRDNLVTCTIGTYIIQIVYYMYSCHIIHNDIIKLYIYSHVDTRNAPCKDRHLWVADGSWDCSGLLSGGRGGFYKDPDHWCNQYVLTDCCETCAYLRQVWHCNSYCMKQHRLCIFN